MEYYIFLSYYSVFRHDIPYYRLNINDIDIFSMELTIAYIYEMDHFDITFSRYGARYLMSL